MVAVLVALLVRQLGRRPQGDLPRLLPLALLVGPELGGVQTWGWGALRLCRAGDAGLNAVLQLWLRVTKGSHKAVIRSPSQGAACAEASGAETSDVHKLHWRLIKREDRNTENI